MENVSLPKDILDKLQSISHLEVLWKVKNYSYVQKGTLLGMISYTICEIKEGLFSTRNKYIEKKHDFFSPADGYVLIHDVYNTAWDEDRNEYVGIVYKGNNKEWEDDIDTITSPLTSIFKTANDLFSFYYKQNGSKIKVDSFTKSKKIAWTNGLRIRLTYGYFLKLDFRDDKALLCFESFDKVQKGDNVSLLFSDGKVIDYLITTNPVKNETLERNTGYEASFVLYQEDVELLLNSNIVSIRITYHKESEPPITLELDGEYANSCWEHPYKDEAIHNYVKSHIDTIKKLVPDYQFPRRTIEKSAKDYKFPGCYVYLMKDTSNGYYKIGISNTPEYRERTLQSEKPTIEMIACKKFPIRKIAESIESALHTAYSQQRLRGEWFTLTDADVAAIIETLK